MGRRGNVNYDSFGEILRNGLSSTRSYVVLKQKSRSPVYLCFKPFIERLSDVAVYVGGKLAAFPDTTHEKWNETQDYAARVDLLKSAWKKLPPDRMDDTRVGSNAGVFMVAGYGDFETFDAKLNTMHVVNRILTAIEEELKVEIENADEVKAFLNMAYHKQAPGQFNKGYSGKVLADRTIGKTSEVFFGQKHTYYQNDGLKGFLSTIGIEEDDEEGADDEAA